MNHGVSTESVLRVLPRSKVMAKRLRCALFDAGADIKSSTDNSRLNHETGPVRRPAASYGHLDKRKGIVTGNHPMSHTVTEVSQGFAHFLGLIGNLGEDSPAGIDSRQTGDLQSVDIERGMVRAIRRKDMECVNLHINFGADPTLGLTAAFLIRDSRIFKLLLETGADTDCIVPSKARASLMAAIEAGDQKFVDLLLKACRAIDSLDVIESTHDDWTPLMTAVEHNNGRIVRSLIRNGARPEFATCKGDPLTIARQNGFHDVLQILLGGIRVSYPLPKSRVSRNEISSQMLGGTNKKEKVGRDTYWLIDDKSMRLWELLLDRVRLQSLHLEFRTQHSFILASAKASIKASKTLESDIGKFTETDARSDPYRSMGPVHAQPHWRLESDAEHTVRQTIPCLPLTVKCNLSAGKHIDSRTLNREPWGLGFNVDYLKAWDSGINAMRNLLVGKLPSSLTEIIWFLAIAKAMCLSGSSPARSTRYSDFASDMGRWQILFKSDIERLQYFREAVSSIWGIRLEDLDHVSSPDSETLASFQEMVASLANDAELSFGLRGVDYGLIASQKRWQSRTGLSVSEEDQHDLVRQKSWAFIDKIRASRLSEEDTVWRPPNNHTMQDSGTSIPIWDRFRTDPKVHSFSLTATLLMAGFIFGVVLTFLLGKNYVLISTVEACTADVSH